MLNQAASLHGKPVHCGLWIYYSILIAGFCHKLHQIYFLPREAMRSAVLPWHVVRLSVRPSVRLSVTLRYRDHIRSNSAKIISRLLSLTISLSADPNMTDLLQREHPQILAGIGVGYAKLLIFDI